jgi:pyruvate formate lyase activating enzyme
LLPYKDYKNFKGIDLLPYHKFGVNKYNQLGKDYQITGNPGMTAEDMERIESWFKQYDFQVKVVNH